MTSSSLKLDGLQVGTLKVQLGGGGHGHPALRAVLEGIAHAVNERLPNLLIANVEGGQHFPGSPRAVTVQDCQQQVIGTDPVVVEEPSLVRGKS